MTVVLPNYKIRRKRQRSSNRTQDGGLESTCVASTRPSSGHRVVSLKEDNLEALQGQRPRHAAPNHAGSDHRHVKRLVRSHYLSTRHGP